MVFTAEEVWQEPLSDGGERAFARGPEVAQAEADLPVGTAPRAVREKRTEAIEPLRRDKVVRSSLEAAVTVPAASVPEGFTDADLAGCSSALRSRATRRCA
jgi:isoleucyl-tRNA synthetase